MTETYCVRTRTCGADHRPVTSPPMDLADALALAREFTGSEPVPEGNGYYARGAPIDRGSEYTMVPGPSALVLPVRG